MEACIDIFNIFCGFDDMLLYFREFHDSLQDSNCVVNSSDISKFLKCLQYFELIICSESNVRNKATDGFRSLLQKIFDTLSQKYLNKYVSDDSCVFKVAFLYEVISLLIKILVNNFNDSICVGHILLYIKDCFVQYSHAEYYIDEGESKKEQLQHIFKFFINVLRSLGQKDISKYISKEDFTHILTLVPLSNKYAVNVFLNQVLPNLYTVCDDTLRNVIIEVLWERIVISFEESLYVFKEPYFYSLLCCFSEYISKDHCQPRNFNILDDVLWKIIQSGLMSDNAFSRKQAIYVFKMLLFSLKAKNNICNSASNKTSLFLLYSSKNLLIWDDLVVLFEVLEEKQIHVIKPVLPKFSRILQHSSNCNSLDESSHFIHPSWITCFLRRMICHESKYVKKQGLSIAMNIKFDDYQIHHLDSEKFMQILIEGFNDQNMYCRMHENDNLSLFLSSEIILAFLSKYNAAFESEQDKVSFLRYLLKLIASQSWCGVAILHLSLALTNLNGLPSWKSDDIIYLRKIQISLKSHEPAVRTAVEYHLLKCCILFIDWNSLCLEEVSELLFIFKSLERHTVIWNEIVLKLKEIFSTECSAHLSRNEIEKYCFKCIEGIQTGNQCHKGTDLKKISKLFLILADSSTISTTLKESTLNWFHLLQPLTSVLIDAPKRPYISQERFLNVLQFYTYLIDASQGCFKNNNDSHTCFIIKFLNCSAELLEFIYQKSFMDIRESNDIISFQILYDALRIFSSVDIINELLIKLLPSFILKYNSVPDHFLSKKIIIVFFYSISACHFNETKCKKLVSNLCSVLSSSLLSKIIDGNVINDLSKSVFVNESEKESWLKLATKTTCDFWNITSHVISYLSSPDLQVLTPAIVQQAQSIFDGGSKSTYASTINCIGMLLPKLSVENINDTENLLNSAWKACLELHGSEAYRPAIKAFIGTIFQSYMLNENYCDILYKYLDCFQNLSENTLGIFYFVMKQFCEAFSLKNMFCVKFNCIPTIIHALTYGPIHHKSQKILEDTVAYISERDEHFAGKFKNYNKPSIFVRVVITTYLMKHLYKFDSESEKFTLQLLNNLLLLDDSTKTSKSSKFANSYSHRVRNRIWQTILLLQPNLITRDENEKIIKRVLDLLESENQQPSVRYLQEWFALKILNDHACFIEYFISVLENSLEKRSGFVVSLLSILSHLIMHNSMILKNHACKCFPILINYCMAQNFAVRLHSRLAIMKLFTLCEKNKITDLTQKYDFLDNILQLPQPGSVLLEKGNVYKNLLKLQEDFYFAQFHPIHHFTLETIFYELPRLSNVASEEWIKPILFQDQLSSQFDNAVIPFFNTDSCLKTSTATSWSDKLDEAAVDFESGSFDYNFQKKVCPARFEDIGCEMDFFTGKRSKNNGLIVVASLIDKIPNLGGLCRTCEIFGINEFIIGSLKYTEDKQFQNLAVSADKWVSIKEVKPHNLKEYLLSLKEEGYTLVGAEQTEDSYELTDYVFPKKSALLLGHEKEGMPADLIWLLDACVEIPQQGIIRSLNVHVTGAIFIWEYAKQQLKKPS